MIHARKENGAVRSSLIGHVAQTIFGGGRHVRRAHREKPLFGVLSGTAWTYQGGGEDGEEDAEAEHDTVAGGLGENRDTAEEAVRGGEGRSAAGRREDVVRRTRRRFSYFAILPKRADPHPKAAGNGLSRTAREGETSRERVDLAAGGIGIGHVRGILDANAIDVAEVLSEAGGAGGLAEQAAFITGTGHGALDCGARVDREEGKAGGQR